ncbi:MAG TPA: 30S ribosomal protein S12 methylthiotransferase RimO, partial [Candidatus Aminicenantes bacterium]|nr:30S ribosomal protein S12 methylthiotransferase RimO [Candidatus Aminicenantes bacterium]
MKRVALISLGCAKNLVDSEVMLGCLAGSGYGFVEDPKKADVIIINTCGFIRPARDEALAAIRRAVRLKKKKSSLRIVAAGCFVEKDRDELGRRFPQVDAWTGVKSFD